MTISERIIELLEQRGMSQKEFSESEPGATRPI